ncbi:uncharacterized protein [Typha latifolia]|uniref:uncharacterized protein n=1 Tax=Typha latifolia TaxID=4733 RepID=UPI003C2F8448
MTHPGKFVSVNLNKSYGQPSSSSGGAGHGRLSRSHQSSGGGGMVVLSRSRISSSSSQKTAPKLSVPPPLNLPSLRKEHERFDPAASGSGPGHGSSGHGSGSGSSVMGWTKSALRQGLPDKDAITGGPGQPGKSGADGDQRVGSPYMPPGARSGGPPLQVGPAQSFSEKAVILRGEDFPSLRATIASPSKQKEGQSLKQKQRQSGEEASEGRVERAESQLPLNMRPQMRSSHSSAGNALDGAEGFSRLASSLGQPQKQDGFLTGPLPLVRLQHTSEWADDERDTGLSIPERDREHGFSRFEPASVHVIHDGRGLRDSELGSAPPREFFRGDSFGRDAVATNKENKNAGSWRSPQVQTRDKMGARDVAIDRDRTDPRPFSGGREMGNAQSPYRDNVRDGFTDGTQDSWYSRRDLSSAMNSQNRKSAPETFSGRAVEHSHGWYGDHSKNWYKGNSLQSNAVPKGQFSSWNKGPSINDPILNFGREKRMASNNGKSYIEDAGFDSRDPFLGGIGDVNVKVFKKKKEVQKEADFHDPVRESFEAELDKILRIQEQERQRVMEEQARVMELVRKEEEERERMIREEEERRRLLEEEAREAAWRAEQESLEAAKRAEDQRIAREEEKRRILMEEERRKEAARQKLLELEARIARRQTEANTRDDRPPSAAAADERLPTPVMDRDLSRVADVGDWEDGERMVEQITSSASFGSSSTSRYHDTVSSLYSSRDGNPSSMDKGKQSFYSPAVPVQDQDSIFRSPRRDAFGARRAFPKKEFHNVPGTMSIRPSSKGGTPEYPQLPDDFSNGRGQRWNISRENDSFSKNSNFDGEILDSNRLGDAGWEPNNSRISLNGQYTDSLIQNNESDVFSSFAKSRHSLRQPRVPPPPSVSVHRNTVRASTERPSSFLDSEAQYSSGRNEKQALQTGYVNVYQETFRQSGRMLLVEDNAISLEQSKNEDKNSPRCDSQSSLSVSSPPSSPTHLSHDEMDVSGDSPALPTSADGERTLLSDTEHAVVASEDGIMNRLTTSSTISHGEDDDWASGNNQEMQQQEEYDEEDDGFQEIDELHEGYDENLDLGQDFEDLQSGMQNTAEEIEQVILGFNEGVEVKIPSSTEFEKASKKSENAAIVQASSASSMKEMVNNGESAFLEETVNNFKVINETEKTLQNLSLDSAASESYLPYVVEASNNSGGADQKMTIMTTSLPASSTSSPTPVTSSSTTVASQGEVPVQLQFGLFSGPSLIPSPVPAIQIGSIQMPIHLHTSVSPSLTQMHPSQAPLFQFGQLRYTPPMSQSILPLAPQAMSFIQPPVSASYMLNQNSAGGLPNQVTGGTSQDMPGGRMPFCSADKSVAPADKSVGLTSKLHDHSQKNLDSEQQKLLLNDQKKETVISAAQRDVSSSGEKKHISDTVSQAGHHSNHDNFMKKNFRPIPNSKESQAPLYAGSQSSRFISEGKVGSGSRVPGSVSGGRGKRFGYVPRNSGSRFPFSGPETSQTESIRSQLRTRRNIRRTEFRVRENVEKKQTQSADSFNYAGQDEKQNSNGKISGISVRNVGKKLDNEPGNLNSSPSEMQAVSLNGRTEKAIGKEAVKKSVTSVDKSRGGKRNFRTNESPEEDVDPPLQSGVVCVFKQSGIEVPSDEDDFIQVKSKKQMLNDRREQRERENKSKLRVPKAPRKQRIVSLVKASSSNPSKTTVSLAGDSTRSVHSDVVVTQGRNFVNSEPSLAFAVNMTSQSLPPIGTPSMNSDSDAKSSNMKSKQVTSVPTISCAGEKLVSGMLFENNKVSSDSAPLPFGSWDKGQLNQQVISLTQTQLEEAMVAARFESHAGSTISLEPNKSTTSMMTQEKPFSLSTNPVNSLLAGEKIQFGAVTSPTILTAVSRPQPVGLRPPGPCRSDMIVDHNLPAANDDCDMIFDKEKHPEESFANLEDAEAEAEAAASAIAVAAISNDEIVGIGAGSSSASVTKSFSSADVTGLTSGGMTIGRDVSAQSSSEESLAVALPADLSVDTPSLSLWPPLPSPQTSGTMISQFPGGPPSHFPCFEMNPMLGGHIFAFGPHDESAGTQGQSQRSSSLPSGALGAWPQCHSGVDSFYGPPAGFTGPFISPGGIPGVQGPPHMVVYNHFAPMGQFGQVGLSFMGTTYIPTGKQPEWKHNSGSSGVGVSEGDLGNQNVVSGQCTSPSMPAPVQQLGPGSSLMPIASPLTMFDIAPFQAPADIPMQPRWSHLPAQPLHSVPLSVPLQQHQVEGGTPSQFCHPLDNPTGISRFHEPHSCAPSDGNRIFPLPSSTCSQFPDEIVLMEQQNSSGGGVQNISPSHSPTSGNNNKMSNGNKTSRITMTNVGESNRVGMNGSNTGSQNTASPSKSQLPTSGQQYLHPAGYSDKHSGGSQKMGSGGDMHRRSRFQGRNPNLGSDKNFGTGRMKQVYVAKPSTSGPANPT